MLLRQSMIGIYRSARAFARPAGGALAALVMMTACSPDGGDDTGEKTEEAVSAILSGSTFEGNDGNLVVDADSGAGADWVNAPNRFVGVDRPSGTNDNSFGQGAKEDSAAVTVVTGSIPQNKNDLTRYYVGSEIRNGDNFVYLAWERASNAGNANLDFEISQNPTPGLTGATTGLVNLNRTAGDILITYDFSGSGAPTLGINFWLTAAAGNTASQCYSANSLPCWGNHQNLDGTDSEGAVNTVVVQDPIAPNPPGSLGVGLFGEAAINLTKAGAFQTGTCRDFGSGFVKSRSSSSFTAEVKDFIAPISPLGISNCTVALTKTVDKAAADPGEVLTYTLTYSNPNQSALTDVAITDSLPSNTTFVSVASSPSIACAAPPAGSTGTVSCTIPTLAAGASGTVTITVELDAVFPSGNTTVTNDASMTSKETPPATAQASTVVSAAAAPAITKAVDKSIASPGNQLTYQLTYANNGNADASGVVVADSLPPKTTFVSVASTPPLTCTAPPVGSAGTVSCTVGALAVGASGTVTITVELDAVFPSGSTIVPNTAVIGSTPSNPITTTSTGVSGGTPSNTVTTTVDASPALAITKSVNKTTASPADLLIYTLSYANAGNADASGVVISDALPPRTTFVGVDASPSIACAAPPAGSPGAVSCTIPTLAAGASGTVTITVKLDPVFPSGSTSVTNVAVIGDTPSNPVATTVDAAPALVITKDVDKTSAVPGELLVYTLSYANGGNADASDVVISDALPPKTTFVDVASSPSIACAAPPAGSTGTVSCTIPTLAAGASGSVTITVKLDLVFPSGTTEVTNVAVINDTPSNPVATAVDASPAPAINKSVNRATASPGDQLVYTLSYANNGNADASGVVVADNLPPETTFVSVTSSASLACTSPPVGSKGTVSCAIPTLAAGASGTVTITVKLDPVFPSGSTSVTNVAVINETPSNPVTTTVDASPAPAITKSVNRATASPGDQLVYTLSYANNGNADASGVIISDALPPKTTFVGVASSPSLACAVPPVGSTGTVSCTIPTLAAGASGTVTITVKLDPVFPSGSTIVANTAVINGTPSNPVTTTVDASPALAITKSVDETTASPGDLLVYTLSYANNGNADVSDVILSDDLPPRTTFVSVASSPSIACAAPPAGSTGTVSCTIPTLAAGASGTVTITVELDAVFPSGTTEVTNVAVINDTPSNPVTTTVDAGAVLTLTKTGVVTTTTSTFVNNATAASAEGASANANAVSSNVAIGSTIVYTITLGNGGNADATDVVITDPLPAGTVFVGVAPQAPMSCSTPPVGSGGTVICTVPALATGSSASLILTVKTQ